MPEEKIVKKINIGEESRYIGAKYDVNGQEIVNTYLNKIEGITKQEIINGQFTTTDDEGTTHTHQVVDPNTWVLQSQANDATTGFIKKNEAESYISQTITDKINTGEIEVQMPQTKKFEFEPEGTNFVIYNEDDYKQILKIIIYQSGFSSTSEHGKVALSGGLSEELDSTFFKKGATFEIYKTIVVCTGDMGDRMIITTGDPTTDETWSTFEIFDLAKPIAFMIYREGWIELQSSESGETEGEE